VHLGLRPAPIYRLAFLSIGVPDLTWRHSLWLDVLYLWGTTFVTALIRYCDAGCPVADT
jgi:hypothetical protein